MLQASINRINGDKIFQTTKTLKFIRSKGLNDFTECFCTLEGRKIENYHFYKYFHKMVFLYKIAFNASIPK